MLGDSAYAAAPFDHAKADIILRSSDNLDFRVFKLFLSLASLYFEKLFDVPQPTEASKDQETKDGIAVIRVQENRKTLDTLLRFCYPCTLAEDPKLEVLKDLVDVLAAAQKYSLTTIERKIYQALSNPQILEAEPLRCFAIARRGHAHQETILAAKYTLTQPLVPSWFPEISLISAADLLALLTYHQRCGDAVYALRSDMSWIQSHYGGSQGCGWLSGISESRNCRCVKSTTAKYKPFKLPPIKWWEDFMDETFIALRDRPCRATVLSFVAKTVESVRKQDCPTCSVDVSERMRDFSELITRKVEDAVSKVHSVTRHWMEYLC